VHRIARFKLFVLLIALGMSCLGQEKPTVRLCIGMRGTTNPQPFAKEAIDALVELLNTPQNGDDRTAIEPVRLVAAETNENLASEAKEAQCGMVLALSRVHISDSQPTVCVHADQPVMPQSTSPHRVWFDQLRNIVDADLNAPRSGLSAQVPPPPCTFTLDLAYQGDFTSRAKVRLDLTKTWGAPSQIIMKSPYPTLIMDGLASTDVNNYDLNAKEVSKLADEVIKKVRQALAKDPTWNNRENQRVSASVSYNFVSTVSGLPLPGDLANGQSPEGSPQIALAAAMQQITVAIKTNAQKQTGEK
jgi:hypothetical protein